MQENNSDAPKDKKADDFEVTPRSILHSLYRIITKNNIQKKGVERFQAGYEEDTQESR